MFHCPPITLEGADPRRTRQFEPFSYALLDAHLNTSCWYCLKCPEKLSRCAGCRVARFCSAECQKLGWLDHGHECRAIKKSGIVPNIACRLLARTVVRQRNLTKEKTASDPTFNINRVHKRPMMDLMSHESDFLADAEIMNFFDGMFDELTKWAGSKIIGDRELVFQVFCRLRVNQISISNISYSDDIGKGLYPDLACYDHSCAPNACYVNVGGFTMALHTLDPNVDIDDLSKTFISYIDLAVTKQDRRKILKQVWYFDCECARCKDDSENILASIKCPNCEQPISIFSTHNSAVIKQGRGIQCGQCQFICDPSHIDTACTAMNNIRMIIDGGSLMTEPKEQRYDFIHGLIEHYTEVLPDVNVYLCKLFKMAVSYAPDRHTQLNYQMRALPSIRICYPNNWPLAYYQFNIVENAVQLNQLKLARRLVEEAIEALGRVLGPNHAMTIKAIQIRKQLKELT